TPFVPASRDPLGLLPPHGTQTDAHDVGHNGTFLALRQLRQYVHRFWQWVDATAKGENGSDEAAARRRLASKMVGRWPSGASLALSPEHDDERLADENDFGYQRPDPYGTRCPIGSHVRRANPRDSLEPEPGSRKSITVGKRHRILRR